MASNFSWIFMHYRLFFLIVLLATTFSTASDAEGVMANTSEKSDVVFLVHGLGRTKKALRTIAAELKKNPQFEVVLLQYPSRNGSFDEQVQILRNQISPYLNKAHIAHYHFIGHSLGGVLSWVLWENIPPEHQGRLIFLGSPLQSSPWLEPGMIRDEILEPFYGEILPDLYNIPLLMERYHTDPLNPHQKMKIAGNTCPWYWNVLGVTHTLHEPHDCFVTLSSALAFESECTEICPTHHEGLLHDDCSLSHIRRWLDSMDQNP